MRIAMQAAAVCYCIGRSGGLKKKKKKKKNFSRRADPTGGPKCPTRSTAATFAPTKSGLDAKASYLVRQLDEAAFYKGPPPFLPRAAVQGRKEKFLRVSAFDTTSWRPS